MRVDVVIAGGGLNGSILALACASGGLDVAVVDPRADAAETSGFDGRSYALSRASCAMLQALGLWDAVAAQAQPILRIVASDGRAGEGPSPLWLAFDHSEIEEGPMGHMVEDRHLRPALAAAIAAGDRVRPVAGSIVAQEAAPGGATVRLADGTLLEAAVLTGCDGHASGTAERAGIGAVGWAYGQTAMVTAVAHARPHGGTAHQFFMPEGPLAILPLTGDRSSIVWTERSANAQAVNALDDDAYLEVLRPRFGDFLGDIALTGRRYTYPLGLMVRHAFVAPRVALSGDAAHRVHPIAGQGLNAGIKDAATLAEVLVDARRRGEDIGAPDVLERYQRWRRFDVAGLALATDGFNRLFSNDNPLLRLARDAGMAAVGRLPVLRRGFIREAAGLTGQRPRLLSGEPL